MATKKTLTTTSGLDPNIELVGGAMVVLNHLLHMLEMRLLKRSAQWLANRTA